MTTVIPDERRPSMRDDGEQSPLLSAAAPGTENGADVYEDSWQQTKSVAYLFLLTIGIGGLQIAWSVELSNGSPYLLSLGLSKSLMALVWIAGPLSGTLVQPYVGMLSDRCRVRWGKRKPFMLGGTAATVVSLMALAWTKEGVTGVARWAGWGEGSGDGDGDDGLSRVQIAVIAVAVLWVYVLDFAINTVQASIRAFIVDCCPAHQQEAANAMASRMTGIGNIIGYVAGYANLPSIVGWLGDTQFKDLCAIASAALTLSVLLSCALIPERDPRWEEASSGSGFHSGGSGIVAFFMEILAAIRRLPPQIKRVCTVQFCAWVGFFPMLFYTSSYIGEIYVEPYLEANPHMTPAELDRLYEEATRVGTFALLVYSVTSLATNVLLPFFIAPTYDSVRVGGGGDDDASSSSSSSGHPLPGKRAWLDYLVIPGLTLRRAWMLALLLFSGSMFCTVLVRSVAAATTLIGLVGITWALTLWAPWAIISAEISRRDALLRARAQQRRPQGAGADDSSEQGGSHAEPDLERGKPAADAGQRVSSPGGSLGRDGAASASAVTAEPLAGEKVDQAGVILGIHNMAIAAPQILATVGSSIVFRFLQKPRGTPGDHSIAVVMALGGVTVLLAAYFVHKMEDEPVGMPAAATAEEQWRGAAAEEQRRGPAYSVLQDDDDDDTPPVQRRPSSEQLSRESLHQAELARGNSFGSGLEY